MTDSIYNRCDRNLEIWLYRTCHGKYLATVYELSKEACISKGHESLLTWNPIWWLNLVCLTILKVKNETNTYIFVEKAQLHFLSTSLIWKMFDNEF